MGFSHIYWWWLPYWLRSPQNEGALLLAAVTEQPNDGVSEMSNVCHSQHDCQAKALPVWEGGEWINM